MGNHFLVLEYISNHQSDETAIAVAAGFVISQGVNKHRNKTTRGWDLLAQKKEGFSKWVPLKDIKESNPAEIAGYAVANMIDHDTAYAWCVPFTLRKCNSIISKLKKKYWRMPHKFGIEFLILVN